MRKLFILCLIVLASCGGQNTNKPCHDDVDVAKIPLKVEVIRLEDELFACKSKNEVQKFIGKYDTLFKRYDRLPVRKAADSLANRLWEMVQNKYMDTLYRDIKKRFDDPKTGKWKQVAQDFELAFKHIKHYYPTFQAPKIYTSITGLGFFWNGKDIHIDKNAIIVNLEFYYGKDARYPPPVEKMPTYIWNQHSTESIVPSCVMVISSLYNATDVKDKAMIAEMVHYGKAYAFVRQMMPCLPDSTLASYTSKELANLNDNRNKDHIWNYFIEKKVLFNESRQTKTAFLEDRPYIAEINKNCPGRVGCWIGWKIIQKYQKKFPEKSFQTLMSKQNAREIFEASGYNGQ